MSEECKITIEMLEKKIERLNNFIALSLHRNRISGELQDMLQKSKEVSDLLTEAQRRMHTELSELQDNYENVMSRLRKRQMALMDHMITQKKLKITESQTEKHQISQSLNVIPNFEDNSVKRLPIPDVKVLGDNMIRMNITDTVVTPKVPINVYKNSTSVKKRLYPMPILFTDFDLEITQSQFDTIPKYMCGRETLTQLNSFLQILISCFNDKYQLIYKERNAIRNPSDLELWKTYKAQISYVPGCNFITTGDLTRKMNKMLDKKTQNRLVILRHLGIIQEKRINQTVCYVWSNR